MGESFFSLPVIDCTDEYEHTDIDNETLFRH